MADKINDIALTISRIQRQLSALGLTKSAAMAKALSAAMKSEFADRPASPAKWMPDENSVLSKLQMAMDRDMVKGGDGYRTTRWLAGHLEAPLPALRRLLDSMTEKGAIECVLNGSSLEWKLPGYGYDEEAGIPFRFGEDGQMAPSP